MEVVDVEEFTAIRRRPGRSGVRAAQATGAVLAGLLIASCGQATNDVAAEVPAAPPAPQEANPPALAPQAPPAPVPPPAPAGPSAEDSAANAPAPAQRSEGQRSEGQQSEGQRCHTSMLSGTLQPGSPGAGQRYADLVLRNDSGETCTLYGYGGLQLVDADGQPLPTDLSRNANPGPTLIELAPGDAAAATLHWSAVPHGDEPVTGPCAPIPARAEVIPPDETDPLSVEWPFGPVCGQGSVDGTAYH